MKATKAEMRQRENRLQESTHGDKPLWVTPGKGVGQGVSTRVNDGAAERERPPTEHRHLVTAQGVRHQAEQELLLTVSLPQASPG